MKSKREKFEVRIELLREAHGANWKNICHLDLGGSKTNTIQGSNPVIEAKNITSILFVGTNEKAQKIITPEKHCVDDELHAYFDNSSDYDEYVKASDEAEKMILNNEIMNSSKNNCDKKHEEKRVAILPEGKNVQTTNIIPMKNKKVLNPPMEPLSFFRNISNTVLPS